MICKEILFSDHAITQMFRRNISVNDVKFIIESGEVIMTYTHDRPYPSHLVLGCIDERPIHIVTGKDDKWERCIVITAYEPDKSIWENGFRSKRK